MVASAHSSTDKNNARHVHRIERLPLTHWYGIGIGLALGPPYTHLYRTLFLISVYRRSAPLFGVAAAAVTTAAAAAAAAAAATSTTTAAAAAITPAAPTAATTAAAAAAAAAAASAAAIVAPTHPEEKGSVRAHSLRVDATVRAASDVELWLGIRSSFGAGRAPPPLLSAAGAGRRQLGARASR